MDSFVPFGKQQPVRPITQAEIDAFNMERFKFAQDHMPPGLAVGSTSTFEAMRDASLRLLEAALGRDAHVPTHTRETIKRYIGESNDGTVW